MADRIQTNKILNNTGYFNSDGGDQKGFGSSKISVSPYMYDQYNYALTDDIVLLNDRKDTERKIYDIFIKSEWADKYLNKGYVKKIAKDDIFKIFYFTKTELLKIKSLNTFEYVLAICDFYDLNFDYVVKKILSPKIMCELLQDIYDMGIKTKIEENSSKKLF